MNASRHAAPLPRAFAPLPLLVIAIGTAAFSLGIAFASKPIADFLYFHVARVDDPALNALEFAAFPLALAFGVTLWRPRFYGLQVGHTLARWRLIIVSQVVVGVIVGAYVLLGNRTPWDGRGAVNFTVVPLYEELLFRGILFSLVLAYARRQFPETRSVGIAIVASALGFGLGHAANGFTVGWSFALFQVAYATLFGLLAGYNRAKTDSIIAPVLLHALMNALPILL